MRQPLTPAGFFVLRTPLLPFDELVAMSSELSLPTTGGALLDDALDRDRQRLRKRLADILELPEIREAVFLASPDLEASLAVWRRDPDSERGQGIERVLERYVVRAASRPTPFGTFAGISVGLTAERTRLVLGPRQSYRRHSRVATSYLAALARAVAVAPGVGADVPFTVNPALYRWAGCVRWVHRNEDTASVTVMGAPDTPLLRSALALAGDGVTLSGLAVSLVGDAPVGEARSYVDELVRLQVLVPCLQVTVTGTEPVERLAAMLEEAPSCAPVAKPLRSVADGLAEVDAEGLGVPPQRYRQLGRQLEAIPVVATTQPTFHVDLVKPTSDATLGRAVLDEIVQAVRILHRLARPRPTTDLDRFREAFVRRCEGREVPLLEAVDDEAGVGFGRVAAAAPLLDGLTFPPAPAELPPRTRADDVLLELVRAADRRSATEVVLEPGDIEALAGPGPVAPLPGAFAVLASVGATSDEALDRGDFTVLVGAVGGPSGAWLLGRFCHADFSLREHVQRHLRAEEDADPEAVWAEVVHQPGGQYDNVVLRPLLRRHEIACLGTSGAPPDLQLPLSDLVVSVVDGQVVVRSHRLGRRVVPRSTTAHDFARSGLAAYRLLASLQGQGVRAGLAWSWGMLERAAFLPRIRHGRAVLSRARWTVGHDELADLDDLAGPRLVKHLRAWRHDRNVPRTASLVDGDATLLVDFENVVSAESFVRLVRGRDSAVLEELFPSADQLCARGPEGRFVSELVVPFTAGGGPPPPRVRTAPSSVRRTFPPGSEWVSAKIYTGPSTADALLTDVVAPLRTRLLESGDADGWFFVRYGDPHWHLRVRFHASAGVDPLRIGEAVVGPLKAAVDDGTAWRLQLDTYEREVERYGGAEGVIVAERLFSADSDAVVDALLRLPRGDAGGGDRWLHALRSVDVLLDDLCLDAQEKLDVLRHGRAIYAVEHRVDGTLEDQLSRRYRASRAEIERLLEPGAARTGVLESCDEAVAERSRRLAPVAAELAGLADAGRLSTGVDELATSYVHLHLNRLLATAHRAQELVIYDMLLRHQRSRVARRASPR